MRKVDLSHLQQAQSLVEFAVSAVFLIILLAGVANLGTAFFTHISLRDAAQEGAAYGSIDPGNVAKIEERARSSSNNPIDLEDDTNIRVTVTVIGSACAGNGIQVTVETEVPIFTPFLGTLVGRQDIPLSATAVDTILTPYCP